MPASRRCRASAVGVGAGGAAAGPSHPRQAERAAVTPMTMRNTIKRAAEAGWVSRGPAVSATPMAQARYETAYGGLLLRWSLVLDLMEMLEQRPDLAEVLQGFLSAFAAFVPDLRPAGRPSP